MVGNERELNKDSKTELVEETAEKSKEKWLLNGGLCYHLYQGGDSESMKTIIALASAASAFTVVQKEYTFFNIVFN